MPWRPKGNGVPRSWFEEVPHWEFRATSADGEVSKLVGHFPRIDYDAAEILYVQMEREREIEYLEQHRYDPPFREEFRG